MEEPGRLQSTGFISVVFISVVKIQTFFLDQFFFLKVMHLC